MSVHVCVCGVYVFVRGSICGRCEVCVCIYDWFHLSPEEAAAVLGSESWCQAYLCMCQI